MSHNNEIENQRLRVHLWRVHASSFLAVISVQILLAGFLYFVQPDFTSRRYQRNLKRQGNLEQSTNIATMPTPLTIWTRVDLLNGKNLRAPPSALERKQIMEMKYLRKQFLEAQIELKTSMLRNKAIDTFERLRI
jgi:hypothetical protein